MSGGLYPLNSIPYLEKTHFQMIQNITIRLYFSAKVYSNNINGRRKEALFWATKGMTKGEYC